MCNVQTISDLDTSVTICKSYPWYARVYPSFALSLHVLYLSSPFSIAKGFFTKLCRHHKIHVQIIIRTGPKNTNLTPDLKCMPRMSVFSSVLFPDPGFPIRTMDLLAALLFWLHCWAFVVLASACMATSRVLASLRTSVRHARKHTKTIGRSGFMRDQLKDAARMQPDFVKRKRDRYLTGLSFFFKN